MSQLTLNSALGGTFTVAPPNVTGTVVATLPSTSGTLASVNADTTGSALSVKSNATTGLLQITGPAAGQTIVATVPNANFSVDYLARTGNVLQVVNVNNTTNYATSTSTYISIGLSLSITPTSANSKILLLCSISAVGKDTGDTYAVFRLDRNGSPLQQAMSAYCGHTASTALSFSGGISFQYLDSPATTSATTYEIKMNSDNNKAAVYAYFFKSLTLMEISG